MNFPSDLKYTTSHEWVRIVDGVATVGITDFAQDSLGDVVFFDAPDADDELSKGDSMGEVESVKAVSDVYAPVSGVVVEANEILEDAPEQVNLDPFGKGWMVKIRISDASELDGLLDSATYQKHCEED